VWAHHKFRQIQSFLTKKSVFAQRLMTNLFIRLHELTRDYACWMPCFYSSADKSLKTSAQNREKMALLAPLSALAQALSTPCPCGHTINIEKSEVFCTKKCGRPHLKTPRPSPLTAGVYVQYRIVEKKFFFENLCCKRLYPLYDPKK